MNLCLPVISNQIWHHLLLSSTLSHSLHVLKLSTKECLSLAPFADCVFPQVQELQLFIEQEAQSFLIMCTVFPRVMKLHLDELHHFPNLKQLQSLKCLQSLQVKCWGSGFIASHWINAVTSCSIMNEYDPIQYDQLQILFTITDEFLNKWSTIARELITSQT